MMRKKLGVIGVLALALAFAAPSALAQDDIVAGWTQLTTVAGADPAVDALGLDPPLDVPTAQIMQCFQDALDDGSAGAAIQGAFDDNLAQATADFDGGATLALAPDGAAAIAFFMTVGTGDEATDSYTGNGTGWLQGYIDAVGGAGICGTGAAATGCDDDDSCDVSCYDFSQSAASLAIIDACFGVGQGEGGDVPVTDPGLDISGGGEIGADRTRSIDVEVTIPADALATDPAASVGYSVDVTFSNDRILSIEKLVVMPGATATTTGGVTTDSVTVNVTGDSVPGADTVLAVSIDVTALGNFLTNQEVDSVDAIIDISAVVTPTGANADLSAVLDAVTGNELTGGTSFTIVFWEWFQGCEPRGAFVSEGGFFAGAFGWACNLSAEQSDSMTDLDADTDGLVDEYALNLLAYVLCAGAGPGDELPKDLTAGESANVAAAFAHNVGVQQRVAENYGDMANWLSSASVEVTTDDNSFALAILFTKVVTASSTAGDAEFQWDVPDNPAVATRTVDPIDSSKVTVFGASVGVAKFDVRGVGDGTGVNLGTGLCDEGTPAVTGDDTDGPCTLTDYDPAASLLEQEVKVTVVDPNDPSPPGAEEFCGFPVAKRLGASPGAAGKGSRTVEGFIADLRLIEDLWESGDAAASPVILPAVDEADGTAATAIAAGYVFGSVTASNLVDAQAAVDSIGGVQGTLGLVLAFTGGFSPSGLITNIEAGLAGVNEDYLTKMVGVMDMTEFRTATTGSFAGFSFLGQSIKDWFSLSATGPGGSLAGFGGYFVRGGSGLADAAALVKTLEDILDEEEVAVGSGTFGANGLPALEALDSAVDAAAATLAKLDATGADTPGDSNPFTFTSADYDFILYDGIAADPANGVGNTSGPTIFEGLDNFSGFSYDPAAKGVVAIDTHAELSSLIFNEVGGLRRAKDDFVNAAVQLTPFFPGNPEVPVGGLIALGLLAGACATSGVVLIRRKKNA